MSDDGISGSSCSDLNMSDLEDQVYEEPSEFPLIVDHPKLISPNCGIQADLKELKRNLSGSENFSQYYSNGFLEDETLMYIEESSDDGSEASRKCSVVCLKSLSDLKSECKRLGLTFDNYVPPVPRGSYEVDLIVDDKERKGSTWYLVKWKNYSFSSNTWEPREHLTGCNDLLELYHTVKGGSKTLNHRTISYFIYDVITRKPFDLLTLKKLYAIGHNCSERELNSLNLGLTRLKKGAKRLANFSYGQIKKLRKKILDIMELSHERRQVLINLKEWESCINSCYPGFPPIQVENDVDIEKAPTDFSFISDYISTVVKIPDDPLLGCNCDNCYENRSACCPLPSDGQFAYNRHGFIKVQPGFPIYECNKRCKCGPSCINRVVQCGPKVKLAIFRTSNGRGWGLKTLEVIRKGQFVVEYLGEIITQVEADCRGQIYDSIGRSYLFDLDFEVDDCSFTVDAGHYGNAAHFMNHSCNPNVYVFAVWINQIDPHLPRLAFFAKRMIKRGEELTFDYKGKKPSALSPSLNSDEEGLIPCKCGEKNCRKYLY